MSRKINISEFRKQVMTLFENNIAVIENVEVSSNDELITASSNIFNMQITLSDKMIGYDLEIIVPKGYMTSGLSKDTDLYPIYGGIEETIALEIYDELVEVIEKLFAGEIFSKSSEKHQITAIQKGNNEYEIHEWNKKWLGASGVTRTCNKEEFIRLELKPVL